VTLDNSNGRADKSALPVAVDAAGGDVPYDSQIEGSVQAVKEFGIKPLLVGNKEKISARIDSLGANDLDLKIVHASQEITMGDSPIRSVRKKPDSSLCVAYNLVKNGEASSIISAGNSGALMAAGRFIWGLMPGIERPAIATLLPKAGDNNPNVILDMGANVDCHAHHLVQFAIMGSIYCETLFGTESPKVALLSNGEEAYKGNDVTRSTAQTLKEIETLNYVGYVEGRDLGKETADVIVCDGFVGNVVLKTMEGLARLIADQIKIEAKSGLTSRLSMGLAKPVLKSVFEHKFDYSSYGGCPLLGLTELSLVLHGSSGPKSVKNAVKIAKNFIDLKMIEKIAIAIQQYEEVESSDAIGDEVIKNVVGGKIASAVTDDKNRE